MRKILEVVAASLLFSCTTVERDNCWDSRGINYRCQLSSSSVESLSSSSVVSSGCSNVGSYSCPISGYRTVEIGSQTWMAENLNCDVEGSYCYRRSATNCNKYGRLYDWCTAMAVCPSGWHLPSDAEWTTLTDFVGSSEGTKLKANSSLWSTNTGTDIHGFSALPGGYGNSSGSFYDAGNFGYWWSSSEDYSSGAYSRRMGYDSDNATYYYGSKSYLYSVRCLQD